MSGGNFQTVHCTCTWSACCNLFISSTTQSACDVGEVPKWLCCVLMQNSVVVCLVFHGLVLVTTVCVSSPTSCGRDTDSNHFDLICPFATHTHAYTHTQIKMALNPVPVPLQPLIYSEWEHSSATRNSKRKQKESLHRARRCWRNTL